ncbi:MAG: CHAT domain-containing protein [Pseudomonadota bacterium]
MQTPVVYLAFANALDDHLATLKQESRDIFKALQGLQQENKLYVHREESSQVDELYEDLLAYDQNIVIFHYGGHADGSMLQLEGGSGNAGGLAKLLGQQKSLKLVFLNGCATKDQVRLLHEAGVPTVIATSVKINDTKATLFSAAFYQSLAKGHSIEESFASAKNLLETKYGGEDIFDIRFNRFPAWDDVEDEEDSAEDTASDELEWALYTREEVQLDVDQWRLNTAQSAWQVQLRDTHGVIRSAIDDQPLAIEHRSVKRQLGAVVCGQCGSTLLSGAKTETQEQLCTVCGNQDIEAGQASTSLPDLVVDHVVSEKQARQIALESLETALTGGKASGDIEISAVKQLWLPYWSFSANVVTEFSGESAYPKRIEGGVPALDWRGMDDQVDLSLSDKLMPASRAPMVKNWGMTADLVSARDYQPSDSQHLSLQADRDIEPAFANVAKVLADDLDGEIHDRLGGLRQRVTSSKTRYDNVTAKLVWLPAWLVNSAYQDEDSSLMIDGQGGDVSIAFARGQLLKNRGKIDTMSRNKFLPGGESARATHLASIFGGVGIGIMVGLLMGLAAPSTKSIVGIFIGAVGVALAALLGLNDRHFSVAKGLRIGSFGLAVSLSALAGIYIRDNGLLSPDYGVTAIYDKVPQEVYSDSGSPPADSQPGASGVSSVSGKSYLFSEEMNLDACSELQNAYENELTAADVVSNFKQVPGSGWDTLAGQVETQVDAAHQAQALFILRDANCGTGSFVSPVEIEPSSCAPLLASLDAGDPAQIAVTFNTPESQDLFDMVTTKMDQGNAQKTLRLFLGTQCTSEGT